MNGFDGRFDRFGLIEMAVITGAFLTIEMAGGIVQRSEMPSNAVPPGSVEDFHLDNSIYQTAVEFSEIQFSEDKKLPWFELNEPIPNGSMVLLNSGGSKPHYWRNDKVVPIPNIVKKDIADARFARNSPAPRRLIIILLNVCLFGALICIWLFRKRKSQ